MITKHKSKYTHVLNVYITFTIFHTKLRLEFLAETGTFAISLLDDPQKTEQYAPMYYLIFKMVDYKNFTL